MALKATGIVVEYNPFHNGHVYHASEARKSTNADVVIAVMSGNFLQRGSLHLSINGPEQQWHSAVALI